MCLHHQGLEGRKAGISLVQSQPVLHRLWIKTNLRYTSGSLIKLFKISLCVWTSNVWKDHYGQMLQAQAGLCCPRQCQLIRPSSQRLKQTLWEWSNGGYHSKQMAIPDFITKCGMVIRVLLPSPKSPKYSIVPCFSWEWWGFLALDDALEQEVSMWACLPTVVCIYLNCSEPRPYRLIHLLNITHGCNNVYS